MKGKSTRAFLFGVLVGFVLSIVLAANAAGVRYFFVFQPAFERALVEKELARKPLPSAESLVDAEAPTHEAILALGEAFMQRPGSVGLLIGTFNRDPRCAKGNGMYVFGKTSKEPGAKRPDGYTLFEVGSLTKPITGFLLADAVRRGVVNLDESVAFVLPELELPLVDGREITFRELATHTSGLPRLAPSTSLADILGYQWLLTNPYRSFDEKALRRGLSLLAQEGSREGGHAYSNLGYVVLARALERMAALPYPSLYVTRLGGRAGRHGSMIGEPDSRDMKYLATGYRGGYEAAPWRNSPLPGAGGLVASAHHLFSLLEYFMKPDGYQDEASFRLTMVPHHRMKETGRAVGLGWIIEEEESPTYWHNGGTGGFSSFLAFQPEKKVAVFVLANSADPAVDQLGWEVMALMRERGGPSVFRN